MGFVTLEDLQGTIELVVFSRTWKGVSEWLQPDMVVVVHGKIDRERGDPKVLVDEITTEVRLVTPAEGGRLPGSADREKADRGWPASPTPSVSELGKREPSGKEEESKRLAESRNRKGEAEAAKPPAPTTRAAGPPPVSGSSGLSEALFAQAGLANKAKVTQEGSRRKLTVVLESTGDRDRDARRMRRVHGLLTSYPGDDLFAFHVHESSRHYLLEFPSFTTGVCADLLDKLDALLGEHTIQVDVLTG